MKPLATSLLSALFLVAGCTSTPASTDVAETDETADLPGASCLRNQSISGFIQIDEKHVLVEAPTRSRPYLITLMRRCTDLDFAHKLAIKSFTSCVDRGDTIFVRDGLSSVNIGCRISKVERVVDKEAALALVEERNKDAEDETAETDEE